MGIDRQNLFNSIEINQPVKPKEEKEERPFLHSVGKTLEDIAVQTAGGVVDAAESAYNFVVPKDKEIEISQLVPEAETTVGQFVRPGAQFFIPYTGAFKILKGGYMFIKNANNLNRTIKTLEKTGKATKIDRKTISYVPKDKATTPVKIKLKKPEVSKKTTAGLAIGAGAAADAIAFAPYDPNLADFMVRFPATKNAVTEWLQTDPNGDPGMERLKNALAGGIPSVFIPPFLAGVSKGFVWSKNKIGGKALQELDKTLKETKDTKATTTTTTTTKSTKEQTDEVLGRDKDKKQIKTEGKDSDYTIGTKVRDKKSAIQNIKTSFFNSNIVKKFALEFLDNNAGLRYLEDAVKNINLKPGVKRKITVPELSKIYKDGIGVYQEARFLPAIGGMIEHFLFKGTFRYSANGVLEKTGNDGLQTLLVKTLGKKHNPDEFFNYVGTKSVLSLDNKRFKGLFPENTQATKDKMISEAAKGDAIPEYTKALEELDKFNKDLLNIAVDAELISQKTMDKLLAARKHYVPLYRDMSIDDNFLSRSGGGGVAVKRQLRATVPIGFKEGELPLRNLFDNYIENINSILTASYKNKVLKNTFNLIDNAKGALKDWAIRAPGQGKRKSVVTIKKEELQTQVFKQKGVELDINDLEDLDNLNLFRSERLALEDNQFVVFRKNKAGDIEKTIYEVKNPFLYTTLNSISPKQFASTNGFVRAARFFKNLLTKGVTMDPGFFAGANALRDTFSAAILSRNPFYIPILSTAVKTSKRFQSNAKIKLEDGSEITYKELYEEFLLNGGSFGSTLWRGEVSEGFLREFYRKLGHSDYQNVLNRPLKVIDNYGKLVTGFENASRFTEYAMLRARGISAREAAFAAREVAVDFGMHGANQFFRNYTSMVPFLNAGIQGIYRTVRALKNEGPKVRAAVLSKISTFVAAPTIMFYILNRNDENYKNTAQQIRDLNYMIPIGDGNFIKIPKPFEFGAIGTILTSFLETLDNEKDADEFFLTTWTILKQQARLSYVPQLVAPIYNTALNKTFFGSPVIPENMKHGLPDYGQSYPWSSNVITSAIENAPPNIRKYLMSPIKFENYYRAYTGAMGGYLLDLIDSGFDMFDNKEMPDKRLDELPFLKRFLQLDPNKFTQAEADFYRLKREADKAVNIVKKFKEEGKIELIKELAEDPDFMELMAISPTLESIGRKIQSINKTRNLIINDESMSGGAKRVKIDQLESQLSLLFKSVMDYIDDQDLGL